MLFGTICSSIILENTDYDISYYKTQALVQIVIQITFLIIFQNKIDVVK